MSATRARHGAEDEEIACALATLLSASLPPPLHSARPDRPPGRYQRHPADPDSRSVQTVCKSWAHARALSRCTHARWSCRRRQSPRSPERGADAFALYSRQGALVGGTLMALCVCASFPRTAGGRRADLFALRHRHIPQGKLAVRISSSPLSAPVAVADCGGRAHSFPWVQRQTLAGKTCVASPSPSRATRG